VGKKLKMKRLTKFAQYFFPQQQPSHNTYTNAEKGIEELIPPILFLFGVIIVGVSVAGDTPLVHGVRIYVWCR
jgi:hypothetical protein